MKLFRQNPPECHAAFRLSKALLGSIDAICNDLDLTRSQVIRRGLSEFIKSHAGPKGANLDNILIVQLCAAIPYERKVHDCG
jgi:hypothetical protein